MAYTNQQKKLYENIKQEAIDNGETDEEATITARDYLYYTRRDLRREDPNRTSNGWHLANHWNS